MSYSNSTPNYNLPQYASSDTLNVSNDINGAFSTIDSKLKEINDKASVPVIITKSARTGDVAISEYTTWSSSGPSSHGGFTIEVPAPVVEGYTPIGVTECYITGSGASGCTVRGWNYRSSYGDVQILATNHTKSAKTWEGVAGFIYCKDEFLGTSED